MIDIFDTWSDYMLYTFSKMPSFSDVVKQCTIEEK